MKSKINEYPSAHIERAMQPIFFGNTVYDETVWPIANKDGSVDEIPLLYRADNIISVTDLSGQKTFEQGRDYLLLNGKLKIIKQGEIPITAHDVYFNSKSPFAAKSGGYIYFPGEDPTVITSQLVVTYNHSDAWHEKIPAVKSALLPNTTGVLKSGGKLDIVYYGDSITQGYNTSGFMKTAPYMQTYAELVTNSLKKACPKAKIGFKNTALAGKDSAWGADNANERVGNLRPDLVVLAFGMNDGASGVLPNAFASNINAIIGAVKAKNPDCEFVLVSTILPNPDSAFFKTQRLFKDSLQAMETKGVAVADMTTVYEDILLKKRFADITGNNINHPNDFLARVYAQVIFETVNGSNIG